ncbi:cyclic GMP-AMP synthase DncV-like nucleotidyltransferase [Marinicauda sp. Alg238-R41]|uniref:cyclic GMP-AMP synthase DncV-like nucleotidyltransferase n=1 Tax=Marinicauda sp. Alg238-R41 TaxID=2993447 RepID=UPI0022E1700B|nr:hypothetical protein [Marinicauda sp. Alg238-R41]
MSISALIDQFRVTHINLTQTQLADIRSKRDANLKRLKSGLEAEGYPEFCETINQGGYAMRTMTQQPEAENDFRWDIDMGIVFDEDDVIGARRTRQRVCDALTHKSGALAKAPEIKNKCVRVAYSDGYQVDFPTFYKASSGGYYVSIGDDWVQSDPAAVNQWFEERVSALSPEESGLQLRRIVRMVKYFSKVRSLVSGKMPSGLLASALTVENYVPAEGKDDESFRATVAAIAKMLERSSNVYADGFLITDTKDGPRLERFKDACAKAEEWLEGIDNQTDAAKIRASWKKVFRHSYFDSDDAKKSLGETITKASVAAAIAAPETKAIAEESRPWVE